MKTSYLANCCEHCDVLQGKFFLFGEVGSPFFISEDKIAANLNLYKIQLEYDLVLKELDIAWCSTDFMIKKYGQIIPVDFKI
nr:hypothetical protein [Clostridium paraputrificum]